MAARRRRDRDSGINDPGDETLDNPDRLDTINEDSDNTNNDPEDDSPLHTPPEDIPDEMAGGVLPGQLSALPLFDGERGEAFVNWLEVIENAEMTYNLSLIHI